MYYCIHGDEMSAETLDRRLARHRRENCDQDGVLARGIWDLMADAAGEP